MTVSRNRKRIANHVIYTPKPLADWTFRLVYPAIRKQVGSKHFLVLDPAVGGGALLRPFAEHGCETQAVDIMRQGFDGTIERNYLFMRKEELKRPDLVMMNPPWNLQNKSDAPSIDGTGKKPLMPELFLKHTIDLFGKDIPMVMFTPMGLRLNMGATSARRQRFINGEYPDITCIVALTLDTFQNIRFYSEVLMFNISLPKAHYFYDGAIGEKKKKKDKQLAPKQTLFD